MMAMTLGFSTHWPDKMRDLAGKPTYFVEKIWSGLPYDHKKEWSVLHSVYLREHRQRFNKDWDNEYPNIARSYPPKLHTIRHDPHNRWKPGMKIHMVIYNRTKNRFQFAPVMECVDVQDIKIEYKGPIIKKANRERIRVYVDGNFLGPASWSFEREKYKHNSFDQNIQKLTRNDGFDSVDHFFRWFDQDTKPNTKIIHWTNLKY